MNIKLHKNTITKHLIAPELYNFSLRVGKLFNTPVPVGKNQEIPWKSHGNVRLGVPVRAGLFPMFAGEFCPVLLLQTSVVGNVDFLGEMYSNVQICFA